MKITKCFISDMPKSLMDPMPAVIVTLENGVQKKLFEYYPDEISFSPEEFIGLTEEEGKRLKFKKDKQFLQS